MSSQLLDYKEKVKSSFSVKASSYEEAAHVQRLAATDLAKIMLHEAPNIVDGPVLEIGAGTGFLSADLISIFGERQLTISDISAGMLHTCQQNLLSHPLKRGNISFKLIDAENIKEQDLYAVIASSFALQWLDNLEQGMGNLCQALKPGGSLFFSIPGERSFAMWKELCHRFDMPSTINPLASTQLLKEIASGNNMDLELKESVLLEYFPNTGSMLKSLKNIGATTQRQGIIMTPGKLRNFMRAVDAVNPSGISASYQILYGRMIKRLNK